MLCLLEAGSLHFQRCRRSIFTSTCVWAGMRAIDQRFGPSRGVKNVSKITPFSYFWIICTFAICRPLLISIASGFSQLLIGLHKVVLTSFCPQVIKKTLTSQITLFPPFVALLFGWVGVLEVRAQDNAPMEASRPCDTLVMQLFSRVSKSSRAIFENG